MGGFKLGLIVAILFVVAIANDWSTPDDLILTLLAVLGIAWIWSRLSLQRLGFSRSLSLDRVHSAAFGDTNDVEDPIYGPLDRAFDAATAVFGLLAAVLQTATFDTDLMALRASGDGMTTTALADGLVQVHELPFRTAHTVVSQAVSRGGAITAAMVNEIGHDMLARELTVSDEFVTEALETQHFIEARVHPGGPAPTATTRAIVAGRERLDTDRTALDVRKNQVLSAAANRLELADFVCQSRG